MWQRAARRKSKAEAEVFRMNGGAEQEEQHTEVPNQISGGRAVSESKSLVYIVGVGVGQTSARGRAQLKHGGFVGQ